ncbi:unnamed protein product [Paramecium sonneborni]|uniref:Uncharacterized protein n=1 Tax=Paramecium sonneborni TaxID=65129 RepID=A0A8S1PD98_9CILI|nr:unnamed protein product [Paramecium sonneborni]
MNQQIVIPKSIYFKEGSYYLIINAKPNSKISQITGISDEAVDINIAAPPKDGEANAELCDFIAQTLGVKKTAIQVQKGGKGRNKLIQIDRKFKDINEFYEKLKQGL